MSVWIMTAQGWRPFYSVAVNQNDCSGVFKPQSIEQAKSETSKRADAFVKDVNKYISGELYLEQVHRSFSIPMFGAFGEKL